MIIRCKRCGRGLAGVDDGILVIKISKSGEKILADSGRFHFVCAKKTYTKDGRKECGYTTEIENRTGSWVVNV